MTLGTLRSSATSLCSAVGCLHLMAGMGIGFLATAALIQQQAQKRFRVKIEDWSPLHKPIFLMRDLDSKPLLGFFLCATTFSIVAIASFTAGKCINGTFSKMWGKSGWDFATALFQRPS